MLKTEMNQELPIDYVKPRRESFFYHTQNNEKLSCFLTGCSEMLMANAVMQLAAKTPGKEAMAMESFAKALRQVRFLPLNNYPLHVWTDLISSGCLSVCFSAYRLLYFWQTFFLKFN